MEVDKSWILLRDRTSVEYIDGVENFINFAFMNKNRETYRIKCPCPKCVNRFYQDIETVRGHIEMYGFEKTYVNWIYHGERFISSSSCSSRNDVELENVSVEPSSAHDMTLMVQEGMHGPHIDIDMHNEETRREDVRVPSEYIP